MSEELERLHRQICVRGVEVDAGMSDLLTALWDLGFETQFSCEGKPGDSTVAFDHRSPDRSYVLFSKLEDAFAFVQGSIHLLGHCGFYEGGMNLKPLDPIGRTGTARGSVSFSPNLLGELSDRWRSMAEQATQTASRPPTELANSISATGTLGL